MQEKKEQSDFVCSGFTAQQFVLIIATFLLGMTIATVFNELFIERGFGPTSIVAAYDSNNDSK